MFAKIGRSLTRLPIVARTSATILTVLGQTYLARRVAFKGGARMPAVVVEPFLHGRISMMGCDGKDQVARRLWMRGWQDFEKPLPVVFAELAKRSKHVLDVGANTGFYSLIAGLVNPDAVVHAFEPVPSIAAIIDQNLAANNVRNVTVHRKAVGDKAGSFTMYLPLDDHGLIETSASLNPTFRTQHSAQIEAEVVRLDDFVDKADLIKIDVESLEAVVLAGAKDLVRRCQPVLTLEVLDDDRALREIVEELNYTPILMAAGRLTATKGVRPDSTSPNQLLWPTSRIDELAEFADQLGYSLEMR